MMEQVLDFIMVFLIKTVNLLLLPIDAFIKYLLPDVSVALRYISSFFTWLSDLIPLGVSYLGLNHEILSLVSSYLVFRITVPLSFMAVKLAIKWYNALKP